MCPIFNFVMQSIDSMVSLCSLSPTSSWYVLEKKTGNRFFMRNSYPFTVSVIAALKFNDIVNECAIWLFFERHLTKYYYVDSFYYHFFITYFWHSKQAIQYLIIVPPAHFCFAFKPFIRVLTKISKFISFVFPFKSYFDYKFIRVMAPYSTLIDRIW